MQLDVREISKRDYKKAAEFASVGMHFDWYLKRGSAVLRFYAWHFSHSELNRATKAFAAYADGRFCGVLLATVKGERPVRRSLWKAAFFALINGIIFRAEGDYQKVNRELLEAAGGGGAFDGEISFLAADPASKVKGVGTALLSALEAAERGKRLYVFTDDGCTYQFYESRGFKLEGEKTIVEYGPDGPLDLRCFLYSKRIPEKETV